MTSRQFSTTSAQTGQSRARRALLGASFAIIAAVMLTASSGIANAHAATRVPPPARSMSLKSPTDAPEPGSAYEALTAADIKAITGEDVRLVPPRSLPCSDGTCGAYIGPTGEIYLQISILTGQRDIDQAIQGVNTRLLTVHQQPEGVGDRADLFRDDVRSPCIRYLIVQQGDAGVILLPDGDGVLATDEQLFALATRALENHARGQAH
jgi:hypothetical protein